MNPGFCVVHVVDIVQYPTGAGGKAQLLIAWLDMAHGLRMSKGQVSNPVCFGSVSYRICLY